MLATAGFSDRGGLIQEATRVAQLWLHEHSAPRSGAVERRERARVQWIPKATAGPGAAAAAAPRLLLAALPGPVRDTLERFGAQRLDANCTRFLSIGAAVAYITERETEADIWEDGVASFPTLEGEHDAGTSRHATLRARVRVG